MKRISYRFFGVFVSIFVCLQACVSNGNPPGPAKNERATTLPDEGSKNEQGPVVRVAPNSATLRFGETVQLVVKADGKSVKATRWIIDPSGAGSITDEGLFTAPDFVTKAKITAVVTAAGNNYDGTASLSIIAPEYPVPTAPGDLAASAIGPRVALTWSPSVGATLYHVFRTSPMYPGFGLTLLADTTATDFTDATATPGWNSNATYTYMIQAENEYGMTANSNEVGINPLQETEIVGVSGAYGGAYVSWRGTTASVAYRLYRALEQQTDFSLLAVSTDNASFDYEQPRYLDSQLAGVNGFTYYYWVEAVTASAISLPSNVGALAVPPETIILDAPRSFTNSTTALFTFDGFNNYGSVTFECRLDAQSWQVCATQKSYANLTTGTSHMFEVRSVAANNNIDLTPARHTWFVAPLKGKQVAIGGAHVCTRNPYPQCSGANLPASGYGVAHICVLTTTSAVLCWGDNTKGQLGNGSLASQNMPVGVVGLNSGVIAISAGSYHSCALTTAGLVKCWGANAEGQLGDGTKVTRSSPVTVSGLSGVVAIALGYMHSCALTATGGVKCWGRNQFGELGIGGTGYGLVAIIPTDVIQLTSGVMAITAGGEHTCALLATGGLKCWGDSGNGQVGNNNWSWSVIPVNVVGLTSGVAAVSAGFYHTCAITTGGGLKCWGYSQDGDEWGGNGINGFDKPIPDNVAGMVSGVSAISAGGNFTCAITSGVDARCWGDNVSGQLGDGAKVWKSSPAYVGNLFPSAATIVAGAFNTCALGMNGSLRCWGDNGSGQLGNGVDGKLKAIPSGGTVISGFPTTTLSAGSSHTCALSNMGDVRCWGFNMYGQLGDGTSGDKPLPVNVAGISPGITAISTGRYHTCALTGTGGVECWGYDNFGQLGYTGGQGNCGGYPVYMQCFLSPVAVAGITDATSIAAGGYHSCALVSGGSMKCWGYNYFGQLGNGTNQNSSFTPVDVSSPTAVTEIFAGSSHSCALTSIGGAMCWGYNSSGQLGNGGFVNSSIPNSVSGLTSGVTSLAVGYYHTCALTSLGGVKCWGRNDNGQLGDGSFTNAATPVDVVGLATGVLAIAAGGYHTCAIMLNGGLKCWGYNQGGQLGAGTITTLSPYGYAAPVDVLGLATGVESIALGSTHSCAVLVGSVVECWGLNTDGQLGDGTSWNTLPDAVFGFP